LQVYLQLLVFRLYSSATTEFVTGELMRGLRQLPGFQAKSQVLEINKHEKCFKVSHNKDSHKVKVLARIYFSIMG
jgi:hypothetical protein